MSGRYEDFDSILRRGVADLSNTTIGQWQRDVPTDTDYYYIYMDSLGLRILIQAILLESYERMKDSSVDTNLK